MRKFLILFALMGLAGLVFTGFEKEPHKADKFVGTWINEDGQTKTITRMVIRQESGAVYVHMWGRCHPEDCDWGEALHNSAFDDMAGPDQLLIAWHHGFAVRADTITLLGDGRLKLDSRNYYLDDSDRKDRAYTAFFRKD